MAKRTVKRGSGPKKRAAPLVGAAIGLAARAAAKAGAKRVAKSAAKKTASKAKISSQKTLEKRLRSENRGDSRTASAIKKLQDQERNGLISAGERQRALNRMTKTSKAAKARPTKKVGGIKRDVRRSK